MGCEGNIKWWCWENANEFYVFNSYLLCGWSHQFPSRERVKKGFHSFFGFFDEDALKYHILLDSVTKTNKLLLLKAYAIRRVGQKGIDSHSSVLFGILKLWLNRFKFSVNFWIYTKKYSTSVIMDLLNGKCLIKSNRIFQKTQRVPDWHNEIQY